MEAGSSLLKLNSVFDLRLFEVADGRIFVRDYLKVAEAVATLIGSLGNAWVLAARDIRGNLEMLETILEKHPEEELLQSLVVKEDDETGGDLGKNALLWLNRAMDLSCDFLVRFQSGALVGDINNVRLHLKEAYEGTAAQYHSWPLRQTFLVVISFAPNDDDTINGLIFDGSDDEKSTAQMGPFLERFRGAVDTVKEFLSENGVD